MNMQHPNRPGYPTPTQPRITRINTWNNRLAEAANIIDEVSRDIMQYPNMGKSLDGDPLAQAILADLDPAEGCIQAARNQIRIYRDQRLEDQ